MKFKYNIFRVKCLGGLQQNGFTLIEMAVVMVLVGIVISIMSTVLPSLIQTGKIKHARAVLQKSDVALLGYISAAGRCPCPDIDGDGEENREDGGTIGNLSDDTCTRYVGNLPYRTIGLSSVNDPWKNPLRYAVYEDLIKTTTNTGSKPFCAEVDAVIQHYDPQGQNNPADTSKLYVTDQTGQGPTNMAYVIVSGGNKDLDGDRSDGRLDGYNEGLDLQFDGPDRIEFHGDPASQRYDDLVRTASFSYIKGFVGCVGMGGGGGTTNGSNSGDGDDDDNDSENNYTNGCSNAIDDDGDGYTDCDDQDCYGIGTCEEADDGSLKITTTSLPEGDVNDSYSTTLTASGGINPYEWSITNNGGFTDFFLHTYTGQLSGTVNQCPGNNSIVVAVEDATPAADGGPLTATQTFSIQVDSDMAVARTSGAGIDVTWDNPAQQETFQVSGGYLGSINWELITGGATGFVVTSTGDNTCSIAHSGTTAGSYPFTLTATDSNCSSNSADIKFNVMVTSAGAVLPIPESVESLWRFDECEWNGTDGEVSDSEGSLDGTAKNGARTAGFGKICRTGFFDGINDYVDMGDVLNDIFGISSTFSIVAWINPSVLATRRSNHLTYNVIAAKASDAKNDNFEIGVNPNGTIHVYLDTAGQDRYADFGTAGDIKPGQWSYVAMTYDGNSVNVTINETVYSNTSRWSGGGTLDDATGSPFTVGATIHSDVFFNGRIDEVMIFSETLSDNEIADIRTLSRPSCNDSCYTDPVAEYFMDKSSWSGTGGENDVTDSSGNAYNGISFNGITTTADGKLCRGGTFTTGDDRIKLPYLVANGLLDFTMTAWIKTSRTGQQAIVSGAASNSVNNEFLLFMPNASSINTYLKNTAKSYSVSLSDNSWHHIAWMRDGNTEVFVVDGDSFGVNTVTTTAISIAADGLWLGSEQDTVGGDWGTPPQEFEGTMDEVYFYDRGLSESEIEALIDRTRSCN